MQRNTSMAGRIVIRTEYRAMTQHLCISDSPGIWLHVGCFFGISMAIPREFGDEERNVHNYVHRFRRDHNSQTARSGRNSEPWCIFCRYTATQSNEIDAQSSKGYSSNHRISNPSAREWLSTAGLAGFIRASGAVPVPIMSGYRSTLTTDPSHVSASGRMRQYSRDAVARGTYSKLHNRSAGGTAPTSVTHRTGPFSPDSLPALPQSFHNTTDAHKPWR
ncbi:uncharacterized protein EI97DRAFT_219381 [Westerdykella ornata]|uniref:Uncharacterized protein n=1 Tax=Westerdykella ornata TaxID=318751 RepID=A0A6A6JQH0_WESOR|nr:uncharacterized protein EI97DRAFT_219381 [Westerdykella ornata]KAF2278792.1 hypothetical protein EI97DRAFT_219381 [Westerdykella ornata]